MQTSSADLDTTVAVGAYGDVSVELTAPEDEGTYTGYWRLADASGTLFGEQVYVQIVVSDDAATLTPTPTAETATPTSTSTADRRIGHQHPRTDGHNRIHSHSHSRSDHQFTHGGTLCRADQVLDKRGMPSPRTPSSAAAQPP